jgi:hypothetical protein
VTRAQIFISFNGNIVATRPADLRDRVAAWEKTQVP